MTLFLLRRASELNFKFRSKLTLKGACSNLHMYEKFVLRIPFAKNLSTFTKLILVKKYKVLIVSRP